jgi:hypothetical protein
MELTDHTVGCALGTDKCDCLEHTPINREYLLVTLCPYTLRWKCPKCDKTFKTQLTAFNHYYQQVDKFVNRIGG